VARASWITFAVGVHERRQWGQATRRAGRGRRRRDCRSGRRREACVGDCGGFDASVRHAALSGLIIIVVVAVAHC
jgi:hypothetical protein